MEREYEKKRAFARKKKAHSRATACNEEQRRGRRGNMGWWKNMLCRRALMEGSSITILLYNMLPSRCRRKRAEILFCEDTLKKHGN